jgi:hypothetical protein
MKMSLTDSISVTESSITEIKAGDWSTHIKSGEAIATVNHKYNLNGNSYTLTADQAAQWAEFFRRVALNLGHKAVR